MSILDQIRQRAASNQQPIVLPEGEDPRTVMAASLAVRQRLARITILGSEEKIRDAARQAGAHLGGGELNREVPPGDLYKRGALVFEDPPPQGHTHAESPH